MSGAAATLRGRQRASAGPLLVSSALVLVAAVVLDLVAEEPPVHALAVGLAALIVGVGRLRVPGRNQGVFAAVNLVVVGQPAVHAVSKLAGVGTGSWPHAHGWPEAVPAIVLHVAVALLVVAVAAGEPASRYIVSAVVLVLAQLGRAPAASTSLPAVLPCRQPEPRARGRRLLFTRRTRRRGPPGFALAS